MNARANVGIFVGYAPAKKAYRIYNRRTRRIMETIHVNFDELITMAPDQSNTEVTAPVPVVSTSTHSLTSVDQDAPLPSTSQTSQVSPSHINSTSAEEADHDIEVSHMGDNPEKRNPIPEPSFEESSSHNVQSINQP
uniref:Integrase, catalytic region, zinc finger, CCHC-type, peptidase aspartic, catalytic n=1 Tax=Tanacetum cinerariifolium TaxID=118510 RepID=A0A699RN86_TANCI|nr:integrase, catalytic region, zinc finger, CCHC-type, peptidase aspartic, catalytic [Tanacetum cinerariifolium]